MFRTQCVIRNWIGMVVITLVAAQCMAEAIQSAERKSISDFTLPDFRGKEHRLGEFRDKSLIVVAFLGTECPLAKLYGPVLSKLAKEYETKNVSFIGINPNRQD